MLPYLFIFRKIVLFSPLAQNNLKRTKLKVYFIPLSGHIIPLTLPPLKSHIFANYMWSCLYCKENIYLPFYRLKTFCKKLLTFLGLVLAARLEAKYPESTELKLVVFPKLVNNLLGNKIKHLLRRYF